MFANLFKIQKCPQLQKQKFSDAKYSFLYLYLENIDVQQLQSHYKLLTARVKAYLANVHWSTKHFNLFIQFYLFFFNVNT